MSSTVPDQDTFEHLDPADFRFSRKAWLAAQPSEVYGLVSDVGMISTWSSNVSDIRYDDGAGPRAGAWFGGRNRRGDREWASRSQVVQAEPGDTFAFVVDGLVRWRWTFSPLGTGTVAEQSWQLLGLDPVLGTTRAELDALLAHMADSVESTLVSLSRWVAENGAGR
ncbi:SRPBCC family protein [Streptomyces sp. H39-S7]|uniref:SRPBCC family protein n=1 Tax=Streptomyces sp. H39-S7 TaxID=3004357 RepID=UPI0022B053C5|nr:SRPBCC family protein [Streptomyces sp. H39-S7]MCZ4120929.1 SRPBCC family protein [Streptomyces sp. H39-S7]